MADNKIVRIIELAEIVAKGYDTGLACFDQRKRRETLAAMKELREVMRLDSADDEADAA